MTERLTIRDLAKIAGVARTTVSLALRDSSLVAAETRKRVQALAREHGYRSHPSVNALMRQVGMGKKVEDEEIIAFIRSGDAPEEKAPGPLEMLSGVREEAYRMGYRVEVFWAGPKAVHSEKLARVLYHRGIRGVVWAPMPYPHPPIKFPWKHFVPIACTQTTDIPNLPAVSIRHSAGMARLLAELETRGASRIGLVLGGGHTRLNVNWRLGTDLHHYQGGKAKVPVRILEQFRGFEKLPEWVRKEKLDALILTQEQFMQAADLVPGVPRASLDVPTAQLGQTAGLFQDMVSIGRRAVRSMSLRLNDGNLGLPDPSYSLITDAEFVDGTSLGKLYRG